MTGPLTVVVRADLESPGFHSTSSPALHKLCGKPLVAWVLDAALPANPSAVIVILCGNIQELPAGLTETYGETPVEFVNVDNGKYKLAALQEQQARLVILPGDAPLLTTAQIEQALADNDSSCLDLTNSIARVDTRQSLVDAESALLARIRQHWMEQGVTFRLPETTYIEHGVKLAQDVEIGPHCVLTGTTSIGEGTVLIQGCLLESCVVGKGCELRHVRGTGAVLHDNVQAGPYVNLRPGTVIQSNCKIGNFVETKNVDVGEGSKLPHLQYIGDATLGPACNIGAGTIFCNYDGFSKRHTTLGPGVFIGSNSSLQGGITIGEGAYVAMASAVTKDVPPGALAVGRARQENKLDYVAKLKERLKKRSDELKKAKEQASGGSKP